MNAIVALIIAIVVAGAVVAAVLRSVRKHVVVYAPQVALLYRDGVFVRQLPPGRHEWIDVRARTRVFALTLTESPVALPEITVISQDQFSFRIALAPTLRIVDPRAYHESTPNAALPAGLWPMGSQHPALAPALSAATIAAAGRQPIATLIAQPQTLAEAVLDQVRSVVPGGEIVALLVTAITLPPEVRKMFTDVERAKLEAAASVERARGEHAALRVLANAARLARDNPELINLRLLQSIEASKGATTVVLGNGAASLTPPSMSTPTPAPTPS